MKGNEDVFGVETVIRDVGLGDRLERAGAHGECEVGDLDSARVEVRKCPRREVQPGGRRRHRERLAGIDGLVALPILFAIGRPGFPADVGRQRDVADPLEQLLGKWAIELDEPPRFAVHVEDGAADLSVEPDRAAGLRATARLRESEPSAAVGSVRAKEEDLDQPVPLVAAEEPGLADLDVVTHEQFARLQELRQLAEGTMRDRPGLSIERQEPARAARPRILRNTLRRQFVVEDIDSHFR